MNTTELSLKEQNALKKLRAQTLSDYEERRARLVAEAFGPVLDEMLAPWPKIWSPISPTKLKFTRLKYPKDYKTDCDERRCDIPADSRYQDIKNQ